MTEYTRGSFGECPLCLDPYELDDVNFYPCPCDYQVCRFCWHRIKNDENGLCPACRSPYMESPASYKPLTKEQLSNIKVEKKSRTTERKTKISDNRKHLASVRVVQKCLVFVVGLTPRYADSEVLKRNDLYGKYGKIHKCVINTNTNYAGSTGHSASAYITYCKSDDALRAVQQTNNMTLDGKVLKSSLGTTKYCSQFLKGQVCNKPDCMYLHDLGEERASFTKEDMAQGKHQEYEQELHDEIFRRERDLNAELDRYKTVFTLRNEPQLQQKLQDTDLASSQNSNFDTCTTSSSSSQSQHGDSSTSQSPVQMHTEEDQEVLTTLPEVGCGAVNGHSVNDSAPPTQNNYFTDKSIFENYDRGSPFYRDTFGDPAHRLLDDKPDSTQGNGQLPHGQSILLGLEQLGNLELRQKDDDLEFDPFQECQKGLEELMQNELRQSKSFPDPFRRRPGDFPNTHRNLYPDDSPLTFGNLVPNGNDTQVSAVYRKECQEGLRALLPNVNISFQSQSRPVDFGSSPWHLNGGWTDSPSAVTSEDPMALSNRQINGYGHWENNNFLNSESINGLKRLQNTSQMGTWGSDVFSAHHGAPPGFRADAN